MDCLLTFHSDLDLSIVLNTDTSMFTQYTYVSMFVPSTILCVVVLELDI